MGWTIDELRAPRAEINSRQVSLLKSLNGFWNWKMHTSEFIRLFMIHDSCVSLSTVPKQVHMAIISDTRLPSVDPLAVRAGGPPILFSWHA